MYAKRPFAGPQQVLDYVGRYTHRVAISNDRLRSIDDGDVRFHYKDYRAEHYQKTMTLTAAEFIRRFLLHVLPPGFHRIRSYGFLGNRHRAQKLARCRHLLGTTASLTIPSAAMRPTDARDPTETLTGVFLRVCTACHQGRMIVIERLRPVRLVSAIPDTS